MTQSLKSVILALIEQGLSKPAVLDVLAAEYWVDPSVTRFINSI
jgi:hypothetical protein